MNIVVDKTSGWNKGPITEPGVYFIRCRNPQFINIRKYKFVEDLGGLGSTRFYLHNRAEKEEFWIHASTLGSLSILPFEWKRFNMGTIE